MRPLAPVAAAAAVAVAGGVAVAAVVPPGVQATVSARVFGWERVDSGWAVAYVSGETRGWCGLDAGVWRVGVVRGSTAARLVADRRIAASMCGNALSWLRAGRLTDGRHLDVALAILVTPSIGTSASVFRLDDDRLWLVRRFHADRVSIARGSVTLRWLYAGRSPTGHELEVWRWRSGRYRLADAR